MRGFVGETWFLGWEGNVVGSWLEVFLLLGVYRLFVYSMIQDLGKDGFIILFCDWRY